MPRIRFATARDVFEAFPSACDDIEAEASEVPPLIFLSTLESSATPEDAIAFCAYLMPRREAVWWACQCVRMLDGTRDRAEEESLKAAESWVRDPEEATRRAALVIGNSNSPSLPSTWLALAAAWSGGSMTLTEPAVPSPPNLTAKAVRAAVLTALARVPAKQRSQQLKGCLNEALRIIGDQTASSA